MHVDLAKCLAVASILPFTPAWGEDDPIAHLRPLAGCFEVSYTFVENGINDYTLPGTLELVTLTETMGGVELQHYGIQNDVAMKHWKETWTAAADGGWTQRVEGPAGDFRYECTAPWQMNQWSCKSTGAAKPRRDTERPYATLDRGNTLQVTPGRWIHMQNNVKKNADGSVYAVEIGWVEYKRVDEAKCKVARP